MRTIYAHISCVMIIILSLTWCSIWSKSEEEVSTSNENGLEKQTSVQIFALWDSLTAGYWLSLEDAYPAQLQTILDDAWYHHSVINAWVSGNTSAELQSRLDWVLTDANPWDIAILVIGGNDGLRGMSIAELQENIETMIKTLREQELRIILGGMQLPTNLWRSYTRDFENMYRDIVRNNSDIYFIDFFLEGVAVNPSFNLSDMIHPNKQWYAIIAQNVYDFLLDNNLLWLR